MRKNKKVPPSWGFGDGTGVIGKETGSPFPAEWAVPDDKTSAAAVS